MSVRPATSTPDPSTRTLAPSADPRTAVVAVLHGGRSSEREVSTSSGREVLEALRTPADPGDRRGPARVRSVEIQEDGDWSVGGRAHAPGEALAALADVDVFFSALHGGEGEGGVVQGLLTASGRAFTGSGVTASAVAMDKVFGRELLASRGARIAPGRIVRRADWERDPLGTQSQLEAWQVPGWVVKPRCGGSSVGCSVVRDASGWQDAFASTFAWEEEALVETLVQGVELTGAVLATSDGASVALPVVEIRPQAGRFFDYHEKYSETGAREICPPRGVAPEVSERVQVLARLAHEVLRCEGYSRSDFILPEGETEPVFLELNTLPGLTSRSLLPLAASTAGIDYRTLCLALVEDALRRSREPRS